MTIEAGARLGPYEILAPIGAGGMGEVYRAKDTRLGREVAVKVLSSHLSTSEEIRQRFEREAKTISQFSHPHICALYDVGREGDTDFLVMELLEGESLADRLGKGPLPTEQLLRYGIQIADALDKAHRQGIVHRDLKPGNVMITKTGVKLLDFGLAKPLISAGARPASGASVLADGSAGQRASHRARDGPRDLPVHGARAARRRRGGRALRHLRVRRRAVRNGDGQESIHGQEPGLSDRFDPARRPALDFRNGADDPAGFEPRRQDLPGQGSRGPLPDGARRQAPARVDRRGRLAGGPAGSRRRAAQEPREARVGRVCDRDRRGGPRVLRISAPRSEAAADRPVRSRHPSKRHRDRHAPNLPGRPDPGLQRHRLGGADADLDPSAERARGPAAPGDGGNHAPLLVARQPLHRFRRRAGSS